MTDIKVILDVNPSSDIKQLSEQERALVFEQFGEENKNLPISTVQAFHEMYEKIIDTENKLTKSDIRELLLKKIISLTAKYHGSRYNTLVVPIIKKTLEIKSERAAKTTNLVQKTLLGGADDEIIVRFDEEVFANTINGADYIGSPNEELYVVGITLTDVCDASEANSPLNGIQISVPKSLEKIKIGCTDYHEIACDCSTPVSRPALRLDPGTYMFSKIADIDQFLDSLYWKVANFEENTISSVAAILETTSINTLIKANDPIFATVRRPAEYPPNESPKLPGIYSELEEVHFGKFNGEFALSVLADAYNRGFGHIIQMSELGDGAESGIAQYKAIKRSKEFALESRRKLIVEQNKLEVYKQLVEKKLGATKLAEIVQAIKIKPSIAANAVDVLAVLKPAERKIIEIEYDKREKYLAAVVNNKCPHVRTLAAFRRATDNMSIKSGLAKLRAFIKDPAEKSHMHHCNNCGFDLICPHTIEFTEMDLAGKPVNEIRAQLNKYAEQGVVKNQIFCKICGEVISTLEAFEEASINTEELSTRDEELSQFIWSEIISNVKYLKFPTLVDVRKLVSSARDACYAYIYEIEKQIVKSKTNTIDEIRAKKRLYVSIYAFAYFIHLMVHNRKEISFKNFQPRSQKSELVDIIKHAIDLILVSKNIIIREIPGMSPDNIKTTLVEAYKSLTAAGSQIITYNSSIEDTLTLILLDPVYKYLYTANLIYGITHGGKVPRKRLDIVDKLDTIMGDPIEKIEKKDFTFADALIPKLDTKFSYEFTGKNSVNAADVLHYYGGAFGLFCARNNKDLLKEYVYSGDIDGIQFREHRQKLREKYDKFREAEEAYLKTRHLQFVQNYYVFPQSDVSKWRSHGAKLGRIYDEKGQKHVWNTFVMEDDGSTEDMTARQIIQKTEAGEFKSKLVGIKCSSCGILRDEAQSLNEDKIREILRETKALSNFYRFFENRCPAGGIHEFADGAVCSKCQYKTEYAKSKPADYYKKYLSAFEAEKLELSRSPAPIVVTYAAAGKNAELDAWTYNFNIILELATSLELNYKLLQAIGSYEGQEYTDIQNGPYIPPEAEERYATRIFVIDNYIKMFITEYNQLRYIARINKPSRELIEVLETSHINKSAYSDLTSLPDIIDDYNSKFNYIRQTKKPRDIVNFCLQALCERCLKLIDNSGGGQMLDVRKTFVEYIIKKILRAEELVTKPGNFNWAVLYGDTESKQVERDSNLVSDEQSAGVIDRDPKDDEHDDGETTKPFSTDDLDIDVDPDADPDDDQNGWKVGENYGLD